MLGPPAADRQCGRARWPSRRICTRRSTSAREFTDGGIGKPGVAWTTAGFTACRAIGGSASIPAQKSKPTAEPRPPTVSRRAPTAAPFLWRHKVSFMVTKSAFRQSMPVTPATFHSTMSTK